MKSFIAQLIPTSLFHAIRRFRARLNAKKLEGLDTEQTFSKIYQDRHWGGKKGEYSSGSGTEDAIVAEPYLKCLQELAGKYEFSAKRGVELGCGDMRIGQHVYSHFGHYTAADVVPDLIEHLKTRTELQSVDFQQVNIVEDSLPEGDICMIRQVLQHLSNEQILQILPKLKQYELVLLTEHLPLPKDLKEKNCDIKMGSGIRLDHFSGVYVTAPPFNLPEEKVEVLLEIEAYGGVIQTLLYRP